MNFVSNQFWCDFEEKSYNYSQIEDMILGIMLNHGIMLDGDGNYLASSPDELSLLNGAKFMGVTLVKQNLNEIHVQIKGKTRVFKILHKVEFSSERKRMTTVV